MSSAEEPSAPSGNNSPTAAPRPINYKNFQSTVRKPLTLKQQVSKLLETYKEPETQSKYKQLAKLAKKECKELLTAASIKGVVQSRVKGYDSLDTKLRGLAKDTEFNNWFTEKYPEEAQDKGHQRTIYDHPDMGDLAGIRIGLYLPEDILKVDARIRESFKVTYLFGTVKDDRVATQGRNYDSSKHLDGRWQYVLSDGSREYWEHYGYKSWQVVVEWPEPLPMAVLSLGLKSLRFEIQVGTVVSQAWAEVQHNVIYKRPDDIDATATMVRMIDAINGLSITTEIMLRELERCMEEARGKAIKRSQELFKDGVDFLGWFKSTYFDKMRPEHQERWADPASESMANMLVQLILIREARFYTERHNVIGHRTRAGFLRDPNVDALEASPAGLKHRIDALMEAQEPSVGHVEDELDTFVHGADKLDISVLLLHSLGYPLTALDANLISGLLRLALQGKLPGVAPPSLEMQLEELRFTAKLYVDAEHHKAFAMGQTREIPPGHPEGAGLGAGFVVEWWVAADLVKSKGWTP